MAGGLTWKTGGKSSCDGGRRRAALRTETGWFQSEILRDAPADQPPGSIGSAVDRRARVRGSGLRLDTP
jgi:hypothetical protein